MEARVCYAQHDVGNLHETGRSWNSFLPPNVIPACLLDSKSNGQFAELGHMLNIGMYCQQGLGAGTGMGDLYVPTYIKGELARLVIHIHRVFYSVHVRVVVTGEPSGRRITFGGKRGWVANLCVRRVVGATPTGVENTRSH